MDGVNNTYKMDFNICLIMLLNVISLAGAFNNRILCVRKNTNDNTIFEPLNVNAKMPHKLSCKTMFFLVFLVLTFLKKPDAPKSVRYLK